MQCLLVAIVGFQLRLFLLQLPPFRFKFHTSCFQALRLFLSIGLVLLRRLLIRQGVRGDFLDVGGIREVRHVALL